MQDESNVENTPLKNSEGPITKMYQDYFLDYASYVILERAVPALDDGLKPVQRRILHAMKSMDDGRFHKVANIIGHTMQYHPHGDAAIGDALVNLGQKNLLIDCQGNWGDVRTGDRAAAARYIEARLTKFALDISFNTETTSFQLSYDGRKKEPIALPMKFPLVLAQGVEGIAVGLSTKILPHNFVELLKASIKHLRGKPFTIYPDFETGGSIDVSNYNEGKRGGRVKVRAKIEQLDKRTLAIREIPYGTTTSSLIDSILKANAKNKLKVKRVTDNTAEHVEILIELPTNTSPEVTIDALYAFSDCEVSIAPNACIVHEEKPEFLSVHDILRRSAEQTKTLLEWELSNKAQSLEEKWHFASLEKIFIEQRIYRDIEQAASWEEVIACIQKGLTPHIGGLVREVTENDIVRLTEIKIKRISKYNAFKADELIQNLENELKETRHHITHIVDYAVAYFEGLLKKYGKDKGRKTEITTFGTIQAERVVMNNEKLYINRKEGFIGYGLKKDEFIQDCSDIDDVIIFRRDGSYFVTKISDKAFIGKNPLHVAIWRKGNERMIYNVAYTDLNTGTSYVKRFAVKAITRDREYPIAKNMDKVKILHFSANPNGQAEVIQIQLTQACKAKKKMLEYDFATLDVKGRNVRGNLLTKYPVRRVKLLEKGGSTLGARKIWIDKATGRLNNTQHGELLGAFEDGQHILALYKDGTYEMTDFSLTHRYEPKELLHIEKWQDDKIITALYYDGERKASYAKRFQIETTTLDQRFEFLPNTHRQTKLLFVTTEAAATVEYRYRKGSKYENAILSIDKEVDVMNWKAIGHKMQDAKISSINPLKGDDQGALF